jgi:DNA invertase Pin-like site-specific DNA recombinase
MPTRVAIYARVSTDDKGQDPENQLRQLHAWCGRMGYRVEREYVEHENGGKGVEYRRQLGAMFAGAARRDFDLLLVWSLDRFSREGMAATVGHLQRLATHGVAFRSFTEEHLSTENELVRNILLATLSSLAKLEREKISRRTKAGVERARAMGKGARAAKIQRWRPEETARSARWREQLARGEHRDANPVQHGQEAGPSAWLRAAGTRWSPRLRGPAPRSTSTPGRASGMPSTTGCS